MKRKNIRKNIFKEKKYIYLPLNLVLCVMLIGCGTANKHITDTTQKKVDDTDVEKTNEEVSINEAVDIAYKKANEFYDDLELTEIHSYDNDEYPSEDSGIDGKREWWYVNFANTDNNYVSVLICDGKIQSVVPMEENGNNGLFSMDDITVTADQVINIATNYGLRGGNPNVEEEWVSGFNYKIEYSSLTDMPDDKRLFYEVIGISQDGNLAHVDVDATTGDVLLAEEKIEFTNDNFQWRSLEMK